MSTSSRIKNLLNNESDLQVLSLRLEPMIINQLDEYTQTLSEIREVSISRSSLVEAFIKGGIEELESQLAEKNNDSELYDDDEGLDEPRFYLLNTNFRHSKDAHYKMLENAEASAFYYPWKQEIERLNSGDIVYLYQSGRGIVGYGVADGDVVKRDYEGHENEDFTQKLNDFVCLNKPLPARKMREIANKDFLFARTMVRLKDGRGEALLKYFENL